MLIGPRSRLFAPLAVLLAAACGRPPQQPAPDSTEHEALREAIAAVQADTRTTKSNTEILKTDLATVKADSAALKDSVGTNLHTHLSAVQSSLGTPPSGHSLYSILMAARRYSRTCDPDTDTWLRSAWPDMSDAEITDACRRDGRWHYLGTMLDIITGNRTLPEGMEVGLTTYALNITPATVNSWNRGLRLCLPPIAVGDVHIVDDASFIHECITLMDGMFTVTHKWVDQANTDSIQRDYTGYSGGDERALPCTYNGSALVGCGLSESHASYWRIYVRQ